MHLGQFLHNIFGGVKQAEKRVVKAAPQVAKNVVQTVVRPQVQVAKQIPRVVAPVLHNPVVNNPVTRFGVNTVKEAAHVIDRGSDTLYKTQMNNNRRGATLMPLTSRTFQGVSKRQLASDVAETGLNFATLGKGGIALDTTKGIVKAGAEQLAKGASKRAVVREGVKNTAKLAHASGVEQGLLGAAQGGVQSVRNKSNAHQTAQNVLTGAGLGYGVGAALPVAGVGARLTAKGGKIAAKEVKAGLPQARNENGYLATPKAKNWDQYKADGKVKTINGKEVAEVSDSGMKFHDKGVKQLYNGETVPLKQVIKHNNLKGDFKDVMENTNVRMGTSSPLHRMEYDPATNTIGLNHEVYKNLHGEGAKGTFMHEVQHAIDHHSELPTGASLSEVKGSLQAPDVTRAQGDVAIYKPQVNELQARVRSGEITKEQYQAHPAVQRLAQAEAHLRKNPGAGHADVIDAYNRQEPEFRANVVQDTHHLPQHELDSTTLPDRPTDNFYNLPGHFDGPQGSPREIDPKAQEVLDTLARERAEMLRNADQETHGVNKVWSDDHKLVSQSHNSPLYRQSFKDKGKAPTKADYLEEAHRQLRTGQDEEAKMYQSTANYSEAPPTPEAAIQENKFTQGVRTSPEASSEVQKAVSGVHETRSTQGLVENADEIIQEHGLDKTTQAVHDALAVPDGKIDDQDVANAIKVAKANDAAGNTDAATSIYDSLSEHLVQAGRTVQAASILLRRSPDGLLIKARKDLKKAGVELSPELTKALNAAKEKVASLPEGSKERDRAVAEFQKLVGKSIPSTNSDKLLSIWKAGLLSGTKTQGGNLLSNATFGVLKKVSDLPATAIDKALSLKTGTRTKTFTVKGIGKGAKEGAAKGLDTMKTGIDERNIGEDKYQHKEINFKNPILNKYVNGIFHSMSAADQPFYYSALRNNLEDLARAEAKNTGQGADFIKNFVENPPDEAFQTATNAAEKAVLGQDSAVSRAVTGAVQKLGTPGKVIVPFTKVPTNFLERTLDYTPIGAIKTAVQQIRKGEFDQRAMSEALGEATTGSAVIGLGAELAQNGQLSGDYPTDPKEQARWKAEGITPNSIKLGNTWYSLNYLGPAGLLFGAGKNYVEAAANGDNGAMQAIAGLGKGLTQQSFLQGLSGFSNALQDPGRYGSNLVKNQAGSVIPSIVNDVANATDGMQRQTNSALDQIKSRIPRLRQGLKPKQDAFGNDLKQAGGSGINTAINPTKPSQSTSTNVTNEIARLKDTGKDNFVMPTTDKSLTVGKETVKLNGDQQYEWTKFSGQQIQSTWGQIITDPGYKSLNDSDKAAVLRKAMDDINAVSKVQYLSKLGRDDLSTAAADKLSKSQYKMLTGGFPKASDYTTIQQEKTLGKSKDPKSAYSVALSEYNRNKKTMNSLDQMKAEKSLNTLKIKSDYSQDVLDFYSLSNADKNAYFKRDPETAKNLYAQAKDLGAKLGNAGGTNKLKNGISVAKVKGVGRGRKLSVKKPAKLKIAKVSLKKPTFKVKTQTAKAKYRKVKAVAQGSKKVTIQA